MEGEITFLCDLCFRWLQPGRIRTGTFPGNKLCHSEHAGSRWSPEVHHRIGWRGRYDTATERPQSVSASLLAGGKHRFLPEFLVFLREHLCVAEQKAESDVCSLNGGYWRALITLALWLNCQFLVCPFNEAIPFRVLDSGARKAKLDSASSYLYLITGKCLLVK